MTVVSLLQCGGKGNPKCEPEQNRAPKREKLLLSRKNAWLSGAGLIFFKLSCRAGIVQVYTDHSLVALDERIQWKTNTGVWLSQLDMGEFIT